MHPLNNQPHSASLFAIYCMHIGLQFLGFQTFCIAVNIPADALIFTSLHFHPITHLEIFVLV